MRQHIVFLFVFSIALTFAQVAEQKKEVLSIKYSLLPISQHYFSHGESTPKETKDFDVTLRSGYNFNYSLYYNLKEKSSVFVFDTLVVTKVEGKEDYWTDPESKIYFCNVERDGTYKRKEQVFDQQVYIAGNKEVVEWEILDETKEILGYKSQKAVSKNKDLYYTVWFTSDIPIQTGPSLFNNLPGVVLWAEDYFNTFSVTKIAYEVNNDKYSTAKEKVAQELAKIDDSDISEEKVFLLRKSKLVGQLKIMR